MKAGEIIAQLASNGTVEDICTNYKVEKQDIPDLAQHIYLILCEYDPSKIEEMYDNGQLTFFITRLVSNNYYSTTSRYYYIYKKFQKTRDLNKTLEPDNDSGKEKED